MGPGPVYFECGGCRRLSNCRFSKLGDSARARSGSNSGGAICLGSYGISNLRRFWFREFLMGSIHLLQAQMAKWAILADGVLGLAHRCMR